MKNTYKIYLEASKNKELEDNEKNLKIDAEVDVRQVGDNNLYSAFNEYEQYLKEKDESQRYRLIFTITPLCSNVLFNVLSEIVYREGSDGCMFFGTNGCSGSVSTDSNIYEYLELTKRDASFLDRKNMLRDTGYSHPSIGPVVYHCGYDIFNNHILRKKNFTVINKINSLMGYPSSITQCFNTISDFNRDLDGNLIYTSSYKQEKPDIGNGNPLVIKTVSTHVYGYNDVYSFRESIRRNLKEENGWFGFVNKSTMLIDNCKIEKQEKAISLNMVLNNKKNCEWVDMYPDRTLYSFLPKKNEYRKRLEPNWDFCITYPYRNNFDNPLITAKKDDITINGIQCYTYTYQSATYGDGAEGLSEGGTITFGTFMKHTFQKGTKLQFYFLYSDGTYNKCDSLVDVESIGFEGTKEEYFFTVNSYNLLNCLMSEKNVVQIRVAKHENGYLCKYYFRMFRKLPNFKNTSVYDDDKVSEDEFKTYANRNFNISVNKLAFGQSIYGEPSVQVVFNDDINTKGLRDNLGREISEVFFTIVKRNKGWKEWYCIDNNYNPLEGKTPHYSDFKDKDNDIVIEYSHCFGKVTEGVDLSPSMYDYNIHLLHNVNVEKLKGDNPQNIMGKIASLNESGVTIDSNEFFGDIVEFSPYQCRETVICDVFQRFNTVQREAVLDEFSGFTYDEIESDDGDLYLIDGSDTSFKIGEYQYSTNHKVGEKHEYEYNVNIYPEGYYYKPHYRVKLREFENKVNYGYHTRVYFDLEEDKEQNTFVIATKKSPIEIETERKNGTPNPLIGKNYFFEKTDKIYVHTPEGEDIVGTVTNVSEKSKGKYDLITFTVPTAIDIKACTLFKPNILMPNGAYEMKDNSGMYSWREFKKTIDISSDSDLFESTFTNGAHYFHHNINFFLRRQDPLGIYGLSYQGNRSENYNIASLVNEGKDIDISIYEYKAKKDEDEC